MVVAAVAVACSHFSLSFSYFRCQTHRGRGRERPNGPLGFSVVVAAAAAEQLPWNEALKKVTDRATVAMRTTHADAATNLWPNMWILNAVKQGRPDFTLCPRLRSAVT